MCYVNNQDCVAKAIFPFKYEGVEVLVCKTHRTEIEFKKFRIVEKLRSMNMNLTPANIENIAIEHTVNNVYSLTYR